MSKQYDVIVYVGRFQPCHNAHMRTIELASRLAHKVIVVIGSADEPRTFKNPLTVVERAMIMTNVLYHDSATYEGNVFFTSVENNPDDNVWAANVVSQSEATLRPWGGLNGARVGKIGYIKDAGVQRVMDLFPQWDYVDTPRFEPLDATHVRDVIFSDKNLHFLDGVVPESTRLFIEKFRKTEAFASLMAEKKYVEDYRKGYAGLEYAPVFVTGDNVAFQHDTVLLVKRKGYPGKGLWALPAGYFNAEDRVTKSGEVVKADEDPFACAIRELYEETTADVTPQQLRECCIGERLFATPGRDQRGRILTHAYAYDFDSQPVFAVEAADDAEDVKRFHINDVRRWMMYADHYDIIQWGYKLYKNI